MDTGDSPQKTAKTWTKTRVQNLVKHRSGRYYARIFEDGKERWRTLGTDHFGVAQAKLAELLKEHRKRKASAEAATSGKLTFGQALVLHLQRLEREAAASSIKPNTLRYWRQTADFLAASWPEIGERELRKITEEECQKWAAKTAPKTSDNRFNNAAALLRSVFKVGVDAGLIYTNPAESVKRVTVRKKDMTLPTRAQLRNILEAMGAQTKNGKDITRGGCDLAAGLAYTGLRLDEARHLTWGDVDLERGEIIVRGSPETGTKNGEVRHVPITGSARALLEGMRGQDQRAPAMSAKVFSAQSCIKALQRACKIVGARSISHHDLRHYFATACIESGVDIPTVSRWLGHKDGGALAMKTYGHLRREHSLAAAAKVQF